MNRQIATIWQDDMVAALARLMLDRGVPAPPFFDEGGMLLGTVSNIDRRRMLIRFECGKEWRSRLKRRSGAHEPPRQEKRPQLPGMPVPQRTLRAALPAAALAPSAHEQDDAATRPAVARLRQCPTQDLRRTGRPAAWSLCPGLSWVAAMTRGADRRAPSAVSIPVRFAVARAGASA